MSSVGTHRPAVLGIFRRSADIACLIAGNFGATLARLAFSVAVRTLRRSEGVAAVERLACLAVGCDTWGG